jgi:hypothetical protein
VVGVKLSWLFTVTLLSIKRRGVWFGIYSIKGVFRYSGILPVRSVRGPRYPELAGRERGRGRGGVVSVHQRGIWQKEKNFF